MWMKIVSVALGGAAGALARWGMSNLVARSAGTGFPWPTLAVNALGCLLCGLVFAGLEAACPAALRWRWALLTGFIGAFTTFSTFALEAFALARGPNGIPLAMLYVLAQNALGIAMLAGGYVIARTQS